MAELGLDVDNLDFTVTGDPLLVDIDTTIASDQVSLLTTTLLTDPTSLISNGEQPEIELDGGVTMNASEAGLEGDVTATVSPPTITLEVGYSNSFDAIGLLDGIILDVISSNNAVIDSLYVLYRETNNVTGAPAVIRNGTPYSIQDISSVKIDASPASDTNVYVTAVDIFGNNTPMYKVAISKTVISPPQGVKIDEEGNFGMFEQLQEGGGVYSVGIIDNVEVQSSVEAGGTAYLMLYTEGQTIPSSAEEALSNALIGGQSYASASLEWPRPTSSTYSSIQNVLKQ
jgi:hypothetical protein